MGSRRWVWSLLWLVACGGRQEQPSAAISADRLAVAMAEAFCSSIEGCCGAAGFRYDAAACRRAQAIRLGPLLDENLTGSAVRYDPHAAFQCVEVMRTRSCSFGASIGGGPCDDVFIGLRKPGEACSRNEECARASQGYSLCDSLQTGLCVVRPEAPDPLTAMHGKVGDPCFATCREWTFGGGPYRSCNLFPPLNSGAPCYWNDGVYCNLTSRICTALEPIGGACSDIAGCVKGAHCAGGSFTGPAVCKADVGAGADCSADPAACDESSYCDKQVCRSRKATGESCIDDLECSAVPCDDGKCAVAAPVLASVCAGHM